MRIAYLLSDLGIPVFGNKGASVHVRAITSALANLGHEIHLLASNLDGENKKDNRISYHFIGNHKKAKKRWKWLKKSIQPVSQLEGDETLTEDKKNNTYEKSRIKEIVSLETVGNCIADGINILEDIKPDLIIERLSPFGSSGMLISKELGIPRVIEMNSPLTEEAMRWRTLQLNNLATSLEHSTLLTADGIAVVSQELKDKLIDRSIDENRILVLPNGVDTGLFCPMGKNSQLQDDVGLRDKFIIGFSGSLKKWHGVDILIQSVSKLISDGLNIALLIIGEGPEMKNLKMLAENEEISEQTVFLGKIPHNDMPSYISLFDVATAPYIADDNFYFSPLKVIEYFACGVPVVATRNGELSRVISNFDNGLLVDDNKPQSLANAILKLYSDESLRKTVAKNAKKIADARTWNANAKKLVDFSGRVSSIRWKNG